VTAVPDGIDRFRRPEYRRLLAAARRSLEHTGGDLGRSVTVASPNEAERKAIIRLTGHYRPPAAGRVAVRLADLDEATRDAIGLTLHDLLAELGAPLANQLAVRAQSAADRGRLADPADVVTDDLASRVLVLNLASGGTGLGEWLTGAARYGTPCYVTLHQLTAHPLRIRPEIVFACQRREVVRRAATDLAAASAPLLCAEGRPSAAFRLLAESITNAGGELRYHGDFDWAPVAVAATLIARYQARPWRMSADDYRAGAAGARLALTGAPQPTPWDPGLATAMRQTGLAVPEQSVADQLIGDLRRGG
jgi:Protein of unknown function C-terminus (DUF2399)/Protein of unknown function N-terminus (DUF3323)